MEILWIITVSLTIVLGAGVFFHSLNLLFQDDHADIFADGIKNGLEKCGFRFKKKTYPVELYKLVVAEDGELCEDCEEKLTGAPMDIADWLKIGFPKNPSPFCACEGQCKCKLVLTRKKLTKK